MDRTEDEENRAREAILTTQIEARNLFNYLERSRHLSFDRSREAAFLELALNTTNNFRDDLFTYATLRITLDRNNLNVHFWGACHTNVKTQGTQPSLEEYANRQTFPPEARFSLPLLEFYRHQNPLFALMGFDFDELLAAKHMPIDVALSTVMRDVERYPEDTLEDILDCSHCGGKKPWCPFYIGIRGDLVTIAKHQFLTGMYEAYSDRDTLNVWSGSIKSRAWLAQKEFLAFLFTDASGVRVQYIENSDGTVKSQLCAAVNVDMQLAENLMDAQGRYHPYLPQYPGFQLTTDMLLTWHGIGCRKVPLVNPTPEEIQNDLELDVVGLATVGYISEETYDQNGWTWLPPNERGPVSPVEGLEITRAFTIPG